MSDADKQLMMAALRQLDGKIDFIRLAQDLGVSSNKTAWQRWSRFRSKLNTFPPAPKSSLENGRTAQVTTPSKTPKAKPKTRSPRKKRKIFSSDEEGDDELSLNVKNETGHNENGDVSPAFETPTRKLPSRAARVATFKEESSDNEEEEEQEDFDLIDSRHEGTSVTEIMGTVGDSDNEV